MPFHRESVNFLQHFGRYLWKLSWRLVKNWQSQTSYLWNKELQLHAANFSLKNVFFCIYYQELVYKITVWFSTTMLLSTSGWLSPHRGLLSEIRNPLWICNTVSLAGHQSIVMCLQIVNKEYWSAMKENLWFLGAYGGLSSRICNSDLSCFLRTTKSHSQSSASEELGCAKYVPLQQSQYIIYSLSS